jgi:hypothetical protein
LLPRHDPARGEAADGRAPISAAIGDRIYDLYFGTAAFLGEAAEYIRASGHLSGAQHQRLQHEASFGEALKPLT